MSSSVDVMVINRSHPAGFFSDFAWILSGIAEAITKGFTAYIPSSGDEAILGRSVNWKWNWNDYFLQPIEEIKPHLERVHHLDTVVHPATQSSGPQLEKLLGVFNKYSGIQPPIHATLTAISSELAPARSLGIHFRAGDMRWAPAHPTPPSKRFMHEVIRVELESGEYDSLYVASTNEESILSTRKKFPFVEVRSSLETAMVINHATGNELSKLPVLADAYVLGRCKKLLHSASNVAFASKLLSSNTLQSATEIDLGVNNARLPISASLGTIFWPIYSALRTREATLNTSTRSSWGI